MPDGTKFWMAKRSVPDLTLSWTAGATNLMLHGLPNGRSLTGADLAAAIRCSWVVVDVGLTRTLLTNNALTEQAHDLLRAVGGLPGLFWVLEGFRGRDIDRVAIADLPAVYLVALDLALATRNESNDMDELNRKAVEASVVAREAEALDRGEVA